MRRYRRSDRHTGADPDERRRTRERSGPSGGGVDAIAPARSLAPSHRRRRPIAALLLPARPGRRAERARSCGSGTTQDLDSLNPWHSVLVVGYEVFTLNYDLLVGFGPNLEPVAGLRRVVDVVRRRPDLDVQDPRGDALVRRRAGHRPRTRAGPPVRPRRRRRRATASSARATSTRTSTNAGVTDRRSAPDPTTLVVTTEFPTTASSRRRTSRSCRSTSGTSTRSTDRRRRPRLLERAAGRRVRPVPGRRVGARPVHPLRAQPELLGRAGRRRRGHLPALRRARTRWSRPSAAASSTTSAASTPTSSTRSTTEADIATVEGYAQRLHHSSSFNTYGTDRHERLRRPSTSALRDPAFRDALGYAIDKDALVDRVLSGHGVVGHDPRPAVPRQVARRAGDAADLRHRRGQPAARRRRLRARRRRAAPRQGRQADHPPADLAGLRGGPTPTDAQFIAGLVGQLGIGVDAAVTEDGHAHRRPATGPRPATDTADWDMYIWGWGGDPDPMSLLSALHDATRSAARATASTRNPRVRRALRAPAAARRRPGRAARRYIAEMQQLSTTTAPYHILFYDSELHAYRTDKFERLDRTSRPTAGRRSSATADRLHAPDRPRAPSRRRARPRPRRRRPARRPAPAPAAPATPTGTAGDNTAAPHRRSSALVAIVAVGCSFWRRRRDRRSRRSDRRRSGTAAAAGRGAPRADRSRAWAPATSPGGSSRRWSRSS